MTEVFYVPLRGGGTDTEQESAHKVNSGEEISPATPRNLSITSQTLFQTRVQRSYK